MVYYPANYPQRALLVEPQLENEIIRKMKGHADTESFLNEYAAALAENPWLTNFPCCLENMRPVFQKDQLFLVDQQQYQLPLHAKSTQVWQIMALSGGTPLTIFGEWTGMLFLPLSVVAHERFVVLT